MPGQSIFFFWLLVGGLVVVSIALGAVGGAYINLRRDLAHPESAPRKAIPERVAKLSGTNTNGASPKNEIAALLREELAAFQAVYRADLAQMRAEIRSPDAPTASFLSKNGPDRLDHAIALARAGHKGDFIARTCDLDPSDAEALVRFHGPERALAVLSQH